MTSHQMVTILEHMLVHTPSEREEVHQLKILVHIVRAAHMYLSTETWRLYTEYVSILLEIDSHHRVSGIMAPNRPSRVYLTPTVCHLLRPLYLAVQADLHMALGMSHTDHRFLGSS